ncbi:MAG: TraB/TrbI/VirB10 family type IV secretion system protein [Acidobacteriaceae bacterium]
MPERYKNRTMFPALLVGLLAVSAAAQTATPEPNTGAGSQAATSTPVAPETVIVPAGTKVLLALHSAINTKSARAGDGVYLESTFPVVVGNRVVIPAGVYVQGVIDDVVRPGRIKGRAAVHMHFTSMIFPNGQVVMIPGVINSLPGSDGPSVKDAEGTVEQAGSKGKDAATIAKTTAEGTEVGTIAGAATGNVGKGLLLGAATGGAVGLITTLLTRGNDINIPQGSAVEMVLQRPLELQQSQLAGVHGSAVAPTTYTPSANQPRPMEKPDKPYHVLCPSGLGCN